MKILLCLMLSCFTFLFASNNDLKWKVENDKGQTFGEKNGKITLVIPQNGAATVDVSFKIPKNAKLESVSFRYRVREGEFTTVAAELKKYIFNGDLPDPKILCVGDEHIFDVCTLEPEPPLRTCKGKKVKSSLSVESPVFDVLQQGERIRYHFVITFKASSSAKVHFNVKSVTSHFERLEFPEAPEGWIPSLPSKSMTGVKIKDHKKTTTPIQHVVVILNENVPFDAMFGTYPFAANLPGETPFFPKEDTEIPDNLLTIDPLTGGNYLTTNRNIGQNGSGRVNPTRLAPNQELTNFESNGYTRTQIDVDNGLMDRFVYKQTTPPPILYTVGGVQKSFDATYGQGANIAMDYWDGNTFTGLWNYAQFYATSDRNFTTGYGESIIGNINWGSGNNSELIPEFPDLLIDVNLLTAIANTASANPQLPPIPEGVQFVKWGDILATFNNTVLYNWVASKNDLSILEFLIFWFQTDPTFRASIQFPGVSGVVQFAQQFTSNLINPKVKNIGDRLNKKNVTWGCFRGGWLPKQSLSDPNAIVLPYQALFPPSVIAELQAIMPEFNNLVLLFHTSLNFTPPAGSTNVIAQIVGPQIDYLDGDHPFDYFASTSNPHLAPYSSLENVGKQDQANHNYDIDDFFNALDIGVLPAVSYIRLPTYQNGHRTNSNALDNQIALVNLVTKLMNSPFWDETAIFIQWDEGNGTYDHVPPPLVKSSAWEVNPKLDPKGQIARRGVKAGIPEADLRAGHAQRLPFFVISPWAKDNYMSHVTTDHTSVLRFIIENWNLKPLPKASYERIAGSLDDLFDFTEGRVLAPKVFLNPLTGVVEAIAPSN